MIKMLTPGLSESVNKRVWGKNMMLLDFLRRRASLGKFWLEMGDVGLF